MQGMSIGIWLTRADTGAIINATGVHKGIFEKCFVIGILRIVIIIINPGTQNVIVNDNKMTAIYRDRQVSGNNILATASVNERFYIQSLSRTRKRNKYN